MGELVRNATRVKRCECWLGRGPRVKGRWVRKGLAKRGPRSEKRSAKSYEFMTGINPLSRTTIFTEAFALLRCLQSLHLPRRNWKDAAGATGFSANLFNVRLRRLSASPSRCTRLSANPNNTLNFRIHERIYDEILGTKLAPPSERIFQRANEIIRLKFLDLSKFLDDFKYVLAGS